MDFPTGKWSKIEPQGELPAPRAEHAAVGVGSMMFVQVRPILAGSGRQRWLSHERSDSRLL
jgi:hypothetical protein